MAATVTTAWRRRRRQKDGGRARRAVGSLYTACLPLPHAHYLPTTTCLRCLLLPAATHTFTTPPPLPALPPPTCLPYTTTTTTTTAAATFCPYTYLPVHILPLRALPSPVRDQSLDGWMGWRRARWRFARAATLRVRCGGARAVRNPPATTYPVPHLTYATTDHHHYSPHYLPTYPTPCLLPPPTTTCLPTAFLLYHYCLSLRGVAGVTWRVARNQDSSNWSSTESLSKKRQKYQDGI